jgi:hypothetical protein
MADSLKFIVVIYSAGTTDYLLSLDRSTEPAGRADGAKGRDFASQFEHFVEHMETTACLYI